MPRQGTKTLVYAPDIWAYVFTDSGPIDVSQDITRGQVRRVENGVSRASLVLNNKGSRYSRVIKPMDRIAIFARRITQQQIFSGYVDRAPFMDLYPTTCNIQASCTLKRLQHTWWNPNLPASAELMDQSKYLAAGAAPTDSGLGKMLVEILNQVGTWNKDNIHVQNIPVEFYNLAASTIDMEAHKKGLDDLKKLLGITDAAPAGGEGFGGNIPQKPGMYGGVNLSAEQLGNAAIIAAVGKSMGVSTRDVQIALMTAMQESQLKNLKYGDRDSQGLFQQRPSQGWGTVAQVTDPQYSSRKFFEGLLKIQNRVNMSLAAAAQAVQRSAFPDAYAKWEAMAAALVGAGIGSTNAASNNAQTAPSLIPGGTQSGGTLADLTAPASGNATTSTVPNYGKGASTQTLMGIYGRSAAEVEGNLVPVTFQGVNIRVHKLCAGVFQQVDREITAANTGYRFRSVGTYAWRNMRGAGAPSGVQSWHSFGIAIDINPDTNPYTTANTHDIPQPVVDAFKRNGFDWGGDWSPAKDWMHFQYTGGGGGAYTGAAGGADVTPAYVTGLFNAIFKAGDYAAKLSALDQLTGKKSLMNDEQLLPTIQSVARAGLRSFMSAPNGDFIAYYPDYFGIHGNKAKLTLEDIEMKDVSISVSDDAFTTHVYTAGDTTTGLGQMDNILPWLQTGGVVTIEDKDILKLLLNIDADKDSHYTPAYLYARYGARPLKASFPSVASPILEYFQALHTFMQKWSDQYSTNVQFTWMPELYPGMRIELSGHQLTVYVSEVVHDFDRANGFKTSATISSPTTVKGGIEGLVISGAST